MEIQPAATQDDLRQVRDLFGEYFDWIIHDLGIDLAYQGVEAELTSLPGLYAPPGGCLLLAKVDGEAAGCVAIRPLEGTVCELKRMYVRPQHRGLGIGKALCEQVLQEARQRRYKTVRLDTAEPMQSAQRLYASLGFRPSPPYYDVPATVTKIVRFMELSLE